MDWQISGNLFQVEREGVTLAQQFAAAHREALGKPAWKRLRDSVAGLGFEGAEKLLEVAADPDSDVALSSYCRWLHEATTEWLRSLNETQEFVALLGTPLPPTAGVYQYFETGLDQVSIDLLLAALPAPQPVPAHVGLKGPPLARRFAVALTDFDRRKLAGFLDKKLDIATAYLVARPLVAVVPWVAVVALVREPLIVDRPAHIAARVRASEHSSGGRGAKHEIHLTLTYPAVDGPYGTKVHIHGQSGAMNRWADIRRAHSEVSLAELPPEPVRELLKADVPLVSVAGSSHPEACELRLNALLSAFGGFLSLTRPFDNRAWEIDCGTIDLEGPLVHVFLRDPPTMHGVVLMAPDASDAVEVDDSISPPSCVESFRTVRPVPVPFPLTNEELETVRVLIFDNPVGAMCFDALLRAKRPALLDRFSRAFHHWRRAEAKREQVLSCCADAWTLAEVFLDYCMAAEIVAGGGGDVVQLVARRTAAMMADDAEQRYRRFREIRDLYDKRSKYVHEGKTTSIARDLMAMRDVAKVALLQMWAWMTHPEPSAWRDAAGKPSLNRLADEAGWSQWCDVRQFGG